MWYRLERAVKVAVVLGIGLFTVVACGPSKPAVDDSAFINLISQNATAVSVWVGSVDASNKPLVALLMRAGYISVSRNANGPPWWHLNVSGGELHSNTLTMSAGRLVVANRTDERKWADGPVEYYAETVTLYLEPSDRLKPYVTDKIGPFVYRIVLVNDPAVGRWQLSGRTALQDATVPPQKLITSRLSTLGQRYEGMFDNAVDAAIEAGEAAKGIIAKSPVDPNVLLSASNNLAYYIKPNAFARITVGMLRNYCSKIQSPGYIDWHVPTQFELATAFPRNQPFLGTAHQWGPILDGSPQFLTSTFNVYRETEVLNTEFMDIGGMRFDGERKYVWDGQSVHNGFVDSSAIDGLLYSDGRRNLKVICVAYIKDPIRIACRNDQMNRHGADAYEATMRCNCLEEHWQGTFSKAELSVLRRWMDTATRSGWSKEFLPYISAAQANYEHINSATLETKVQAATRDIAGICHVSDDEAACPSSQSSLQAQAGVIRSIVTGLRTNLRGARLSYSDLSANGHTVYVTILDHAHISNARKIILAVAASKGHSNVTELPGGRFTLDVAGANSGSSPARCADIRQ